MRYSAAAHVVSSFTQACNSERARRGERTSAHAPRYKKKAFDWLTGSPPTDERRVSRRSISMAQTTEKHVTQAELWMKTVAKLGRIVVFASRCESFFLFFFFLSFFFFFVIFFLFFDQLHRITTVWMLVLTLLFCQLTFLPASLRQSVLILLFRLPRISASLNSSDTCK